MNFDDLKAAWNNDLDDSINIPQNLESLKGAQSPIEKVKKNLRLEFWLYVAFYVIFIALPFVTNRLTPVSTVVYYTLLLTMFMPMAYYTANFYKFYGRLNRLSFTTKDSLDEAYFELKHFTEIYTVMQHFIAPTCFLLGLLAGLGQKAGKTLDKIVGVAYLQHDGIIILSILLISFITLMIGFIIYIKWYVNRLYGKYLNELNAIRKELKETE
ncbi:hypothetical protein C3K47_14865 [Solitalea longa]|uniref:Uncharacterized protein n=1 Tax=Solitalea longa TaxID=2079460 RepID=A0A2S4ZZB2_9SPHI|nr:hypothetical protein [Solitalea longa]POY35671.1 hypothetical protein C3K47_14865 [Solitalea longa]